MQRVICRGNVLQKEADVSRPSCNFPWQVSPIEKQVPNFCMTWRDLMVRSVFPPDGARLGLPLMPPHPPPSKEHPTVVAPTCPPPCHAPSVQGDWWLPWQIHRGNLSLMRLPFIVLRPTTRTSPPEPWPRTKLCTRLLQNPTRTQ